MAVDMNNCLKRLSVHLEGMSRRLNLLWGCVSSMEREWEALSKMKISSDSCWSILQHDDCSYERSNNFQEPLDIGHSTTLCHTVLWLSRVQWGFRCNMSKSASLCPSLNACLALYLTILFAGHRQLYAFTMIALIYAWHASHTWKQAGI